MSPQLYSVQIGETEGERKTFLEGAERGPHCEITRKNT